MCVCACISDAAIEIGPYLYECKRRIMAIGKQCLNRIGVFKCESESDALINPSSVCEHDLRCVHNGIESTLFLKTVSLFFTKRVCFYTHTHTHCLTAINATHATAVVHSHNRYKIMGA